MSSNAEAAQGNVDLSEAHQVFPSEIFGIIGQFLAGRHQLRTLANMNVTSHDIHFETMPTLYETVNFRVPQKLGEYEGKLCTFPEGFRYTRFCIFGEWKNHTRSLPEALLQQLRTWTSKMPKLKATFITNRTGPSARLSCYIYLHKPITISEVFECVAVSPLLSPHGLDVVSYELDPNAYLKPDKRVIHAANGTFDVRLSLNWLTAKHATDKTHIIDSLLELLKLGGYQTKRPVISCPQPSHNNIASRGTIYPGQIDYVADDRVWGWPLTKLYLTCPQIRIFADKLAIAAETYPRILRNQLQIGVRDREIDRKSLTESLDRLYTIYRRHLPSSLDTHPSRWSARPMPRTDTIIDISRIRSNLAPRPDLEYVIWSKTLNLSTNGSRRAFSIFTNVWDFRDDEYADRHVFQQH